MVRRLADLMYSYRKNIAQFFLELRRMELARKDFTFIGTFLVCFQKADDALVLLPFRDL